jgi:hypothetical protein
MWTKFRNFGYLEDKHNTAYIFHLGLTCSRFFFCLESIVWRASCSIPMDFFYQVCFFELNLTEATLFQEETFYNGHDIMLRLAYPFIRVEIFDRGDSSQYCIILSALAHLCTCTIITSTMLLKMRLLISVTCRWYIPIFLLML